MALSTLNSGSLQSFLNLLDAKEMVPARLEFLLSSGILADVCDKRADFSNRDAIRAALKLDRIMPDIFRFTVNYRMPYGEMVSDGKYRSVNSKITADLLPIVGSGEIEFEGRYIYLNRVATADEVLRRIKEEDLKNPWLPAKIEHLLMRGKIAPGEQCRYRIIALGSWTEIGTNSEKERVYPMLNGVGNEEKNQRFLELTRQSAFIPTARFLAVRIPLPPVQAPTPAEATTS